MICVVACTLKFSFKLWHGTTSKMKSTYNSEQANKFEFLWKDIFYLELHLAAVGACSPVSCGSLGGISPRNQVL